MICCHQKYLATFNNTNYMFKLKFKAAEALYTKFQVYVSIFINQDNSKGITTERFK